MPRQTIEERSDPKIAERFLAMAGTSGAGGLPDYLGLELVRFEPGKLWCRATIRDELLTPFGNVHGGVIAGIVALAVAGYVWRLLTWTPRAERAG